MEKDTATHEVRISTASGASSFEAGQNLVYPPINPALADKVNGINPEELTGLNNHAFSRDLLHYGINAVLLLHLLRKAKALQNPSQKEISRFIAQHSIEFKDKNDFDICNASLESLRDDGIFIPPQREERIEFFNCDNLNNIGCHSPIHLGEPELVNLCKTPWKEEYFANTDLLEKGTLLAKDLWTVSAINFERLAGGTPDQPPQKPEITAIGRELIEYYWQIINVDQTPENPGRKWISYTVESNQSVEDEEDGLNKVFIGSFPDLFSALAKKERTPKGIQIIQGKTRREIAAKIIELGLI